MQVRRCARYGEVIKINKQQLEPIEEFEPIEEWIEKWGADLGEVAKVMLRIAVIEAIEENVARAKVEKEVIHVPLQDCMDCKHNYSVGNINMTICCSRGSRQRNLIDVIDIVEGKIK